MNYGEFGGQYVPQELKEKLNEIEEEFSKAKEEKKFNEQYLYYLKQYVGRPTSLYFAENLTKYVGGGSNSIGLFTDFIKEKDVDIYGVEGAGIGLETGLHSSAIYNNKIGIMHGMKTYIMQDELGDIKEAYSISAGLDYPGIGPEHAYLKSINRVKYDSVTDEEAVKAFKLLCRQEGIIPALESSHAVAYAIKIGKKYDKEDCIIINLSGRGDKDVDTILSIA